MTLQYAVYRRARPEWPWCLHRTVADPLLALELAHAVEESTYESKIVPCAVLRATRPGWRAK